ncbi:hypothetical protein JKI95_08635 [Corynebacterium aquatimens]|uniref:hypothetical protein n=1 Tax=Corynebacterium TaxID=1716 RepID=UPI001F297386|nr:MULTISPECIES: hypothetical protein [Corynebacterium]QYH19251.1 hypothetical protein JKI95_08635 [Corynebacterium aquatimens]UIZ91858.1 hypothetical protein JZY91_09215 [Corynebacterium sp. CNCTC7651]
MAVYTNPGVPGDLPLDAAGKANVQVNDNQFEGTTPCAQVSGQLSREDAPSGDSASPTDLPTVTLTSVDLAAPDDTCIGGARYTHDQLASLLVPGATFSVRELSDTERLLVTVPDAAAPQLDPPSIRLMRL